MKEKKEKKELKIEREYVIPLREKCRPVPRYKKTNKAVKTVKEFLVRHMKIRDRDLKKIKLDIYLNEFLWLRGIKNPPHKIKVKVVKEGEFVRVFALDLPKNIKFKKEHDNKKEKVQEKMAEKIKESKKSMMDKAKEGLHANKEGKEEKKLVEDVEKDKKVSETKDEKETEKEIEKEKSVESSNEKLEKEAKVKEKHLSKSQKQSKNVRIGYNQTSRGH